MNIALLLEMAADGMADRVAVGSAQGGMTYRTLLDTARRVATLVRESDAARVALVDLNSDALPALLFGSGIASVPFAPLNYRLASERLRSLLDRVAPALVVAADEAAKHAALHPGLYALDRDELVGCLTEKSPAVVVESDPDAVAVWLFTSGTTGEPKAALLRHRHLVAYVLATVEFMAADENEAALVTVPPYHIAGIASILSNVYAGRRLVYLPQFDPHAWVRLARAEAVTHAMVVPTMLGRILDALEESGQALPALAHLSYGGGRMPRPVIERAMDLLPAVGFVNAYGLTETSSTIAVLGSEEHQIAKSSGDRAVRERLGSVGRPLPSLELEIRGSDGKPVPAGVTGEICVRGEQIAGEYVGRSALTVDGWFLTNDGGHLDASGFLFVEGRLDDVIVRGGENLSPGEIEDELLRHPAVGEAGVTGIADDEWGEAVAAAVVLHPGASVSELELQSFVRDRLRSSRVPVVVEFRDSLPHTETGKLLRRALRDDLERLRQSRR